MKNLWILTEERPKEFVITEIIKKFAYEKNVECKIDQVKILPIIKGDKFTFIYKVLGVKCELIDNFFIKIISGNSSLVDFLIFYQELEPTIYEKPIYAIEETKTDDSESRNTGVYQRCSKFVFIDYYYPDIKKVMLYNIRVLQNEHATSTNIFGTRMLLTIGVEISGKNLDSSIFKPFQTLDELINVKRNMRRPPAGNVPIDITKFNDKITISGRLIKSNSLSHDPNIGALSIISKTIRKLGWNKDIVITKHGLSQKHISSNNKFIKIANQLNLKLDGLIVPTANFANDYWKYEENGEKLVSIFVHLLIEGYTNGYSIYENHAGCERGYFLCPQNECIAIEKYEDKDKYKNGDKTKIIFIPDLILYDIDRKKIINIEGKKYEKKNDGIKEINNLGPIEERYIKKYYPNINEIIRSVVLFGGKDKIIYEPQVGFLLTKDGSLILGPKAPQLFHEAINKLLR